MHALRRGSRADGDSRGRRGLPGCTSTSALLATIVLGMLAWALVSQLVAPIRSWPSPTKKQLIEGWGRHHRQSNQLRSSQSNEPAASMAGGTVHSGTSNPAPATTPSPGLPKPADCNCCSSTNHRNCVHCYRGVPLSHLRDGGESVCHDAAAVQQTLVGGQQPVHPSSPPGVDLRATTGIVTVSVSPGEAATPQPPKAGHITYNQQGQLNVSLACRHGPYVWDRWTKARTEGIGIRMLSSQHKHSLMLADALDAVWIANLVNGHEKDFSARRADSVLGYFGLGTDDCDHAALLSHKASESPTGLKFLETDALYKDHADLACNITGRCAHSHVCACPRWTTLCSGNMTAQQRRAQLGIDRNTVLEISDPGSALDDGWSWNYCTFSPRFRSRYYGAQQKHAPRRLRPSSEFWIAVHFRWGDEAQMDPDKPDYRTGSGLTEISNRVAVYANEHPGARVFFLSQTPERTDFTKCALGMTPSVDARGRSERNKPCVLINLTQSQIPDPGNGDRTPFSIFRKVIPAAEPLLDGDWKDSLWTLAQSNVLVGGPSTFFMLGAHLCGNCTVVVNHAAVSRQAMNSVYNSFRAHSTELEAAKHHTVLYRAGADVAVSTTAKSQA